MSSANEMRAKADAVQKIKQSEIDAAALAEARANSKAAEEMMVATSSLEEIEKAANKGRTFLCANSSGPDYSGQEYNHYVDSLKMGLLERHLKKLKKLGYKVDLTGLDTGRPDLKVSW